jgi:hypothetical protein
MDAVNRYWQIVRALVFARGLIVVLLGLFYLLAMMLSITLEADKKASIILVLSAIPACGFLATATERVVQYSLAGASLGIPRHVEFLRNGQIAVMCLFVGIPACVGLKYGGLLSHAALLVVPAAGGVFLALKARWVFAAWIVLAVGTRFSFAQGDALLGLNTPAVRIALIMVSLGILYRWLGLPSRTEKRARGVSTVLADARHEASATSISDAIGTERSQVELLDKAYEREIDEVTAGITDAGLMSRALALGLAIDVRPNWRGIAIMIGIGWVVLFILHFVYRHDVRGTVYIWIAFFAASALFSRVKSVHQAWQRHGAEAALLVLSPRWPGEGQVKQILVEMLVKSQVGVWLTWIFIILPYVVLGWLGQTEAGASILLMGATSCGASGALLLALSRRYFKELSFMSIALLLCSAGGACVYLFGAVAVPYARSVGTTIIILPLIVGGLCFSFRPLQFPVRIVSKQ